jgi:hypothetical protein
MNPFILALMTAGIFVFVTKLNKYQDNRAERNKTIEPEERADIDLAARPTAQTAGLGRYHEESPYGLTTSSDTKSHLNELDAENAGHND